MPRRGNVPKREVLPDPIYNSVLVTKLVNSIMLDGKKGVAQKVVYGAFDIIKEKTEKDPLDVFTTALENPWLAAMLLLCLFFDCLAMIVVCITKVMNGNRCGQVNVCFLHVLPALLYETCFAINS